MACPCGCGSTTSCGAPPFARPVPSQGPVERPEQRSATARNLGLCNTLAQTLVGVADSLRDLYTTFGLRPYVVSIVKTRWSGGLRGKGVEFLEGNPITLLPTPLITDISSLTEVNTPVGADEFGEILLQQVSGAYTEDFLRGTIWKVARSARTSSSTMRSSSLRPARGGKVSAAASQSRGRRPTSPTPSSGESASSASAKTVLAAVSLVGKLNTAQWAAHQKKLAKDYWPAVIRGAKAGALRGVAVLQRRTQSAPAFDTGRYIRSWKHSVSNTAVKFWNEAPYAAVIERGRRPGATPPPVKAILPWVKRKLGVSAAEAKGVAFVVARSIGRKGIRGKKVLIRAQAELSAVLEEEIMASVKAVLSRV